MLIFSYAALIESAAAALHVHALRLGAGEEVSDIEVKENRLKQILPSALILFYPLRINSLG